jgi:hypothetical protein
MEQEFIIVTLNTNYYKNELQRIQTLQRIK